MTAWYAKYTSLAHSVDRAFVRAFYGYGRIVYKRRWAAIGLSILITLLCSIGLYWLYDMRILDPDYVFTPSDGRYHFEKAVLEEHWPFDEENFLPLKTYEYTTWNDVIIKRHDDGNVLELEYLEQLLCFNEYVLQAMAVKLEADDFGANTTVDVGFERLQVEEVFYEPDLCLRAENRCFRNNHVELLFQYSTQRQKLADYAANEGNSSITQFELGYICWQLGKELALQYPTAQIGRKPTYLGESIADVALSSAPSNDSTSTNDDDDQQDLQLCDFDLPNYVQSAKYMRLTYNLRDSTEQISHYSSKWKRQLEEVHRGVGPYAAEMNATCGPNFYKRFQIGLNQKETLATGLNAVTQYFLSDIILCITVLVTFAVGCSFVLLKHNGRIVGIDWTRSKPWIAVAGLISTVLSIISVFGLMFLCGQWWNEMASVMPFLVLAIGIDDMFILLAAWHRTCSTDSAEVRLATCLSEAAVSITITTLTDCISFFIGCYTTLPGVAMFCLMTAVGLLFAYVHILLFVVGWMAVFADLEHQQRHTLLPWLTTKQHGVHNLSLLGRVFGCGSAFSSPPAGADNEVMHPADAAAQHTGPPRTPISPTYSTHSTHEVPDEAENLSSKFFKKIYGPIILHPISKWLVLLGYIAYLTGGIYGLTKATEGLNPRFLVLEGDPFLRFLSMMQQSFFQRGKTMAVIVNNAPNLAIPFYRERMHELAHAYEYFPHGLGEQFGSNATIFWLDIFERDWLTRFNKYEEVDHHTEKFYQQAFDWLRQAEGADYWNLDIKWENIEDAKAERHLVGYDNFTEIDVDEEMKNIWPAWGWHDAEDHTLRHSTLAPDPNATQIINTGFLQFHVPKAQLAELENLTHIHLQDVQTEMMFRLCTPEQQRLTLRNYNTLEPRDITGLCAGMASKWKSRRTFVDFDEYNIYDLYDDWTEFWQKIRRVNYRIIKAFRFQIGLAKYNTTHDQRDTLSEVREIAARFPEFNVTAYNQYQNFADQYLIIVDTMIQNILIALPAMMIIALVMIPSIVCAALICLAILSIDVGVVGYMSLWDVHIDCVSMISIIMSIGFAVDFTAHISYAYVTSVGSNDERCIRALRALGWPVLQGALSTLFGISVLSSARSYMIQTFFKTIFLVIVFGLLHGILLLPIVLHTFMPYVESWTGRSGGSGSGHPVKAPITDRSAKVGATEMMAHRSHKQPPPAPLTLTDRQMGDEDL